MAKKLAEQPADAAADTLPATSLNDPTQLTPATSPSQSSPDSPPTSDTPLNESPGGEPTYGDVEPAPGTAPATDETPPSGEAPSGEAPSDTTGTTGTTGTTTPAPAPTPELSEEELVALVVKHADADATFIPYLLGQLDESTEAEQEDGMRSFVKKYLGENPEFAQTLADLIVVAAPSSEGAPAPVETPPVAVPTNPEPAAEPTPEPTAETLPVTPPAPAPTPEPAATPTGPQDSFPVDKVYGWGREVNVTFGLIVVPGTISGIYFDGDGVTYEVAVHVKDAVPSFGTPAKQAKITVSAELVSA